MLTSILQIIVSVAVGWMLFWTTQHEGEPRLFIERMSVLNWFDFIIQILVAGSIYALGEAIVSYEIFTGKILPRQGFRRHWRNAIVVSTGFSVLLSLALALALPPIYDMMVATVLIALFYALLNWRSYRERDRYLEHLRPFLGSQQLYEGLLAGAGSDGASANGSLPFRALCADVLGARRAFLVPLGPMAPLAGAPLSYPGSTPPVFPLLADLAAGFDSPRTLCVPLEPERFDGAVWAIPLWSERGLIGVLMLGEKLDGNLYTQEEMEIARTSGERLIDIQAGVEMARRLVAMQRRRLAESQVIDAQTRRVLHDDVLPQLHSVMLTLGASEPGSGAIGIMGDLHRKISDLLRELPTPATQPAGRLGLLGAIRGAVEAEFRNLFDSATLTIREGAERNAGRVSRLAADVGYYAAREAMRNAAKYGRGGRQECPLHLSVEIVARGEGIEITIEDDGVGLDPNRASEGGSGQGLALHSTMMAVVGGSLAVESSPGAFTRVTLTLPGGG
jgi:signal transduction histidine kinase